MYVSVSVSVYVHGYVHVCRLQTLRSNCKDGTCSSCSKLEKLSDVPGFDRPGSDGKCTRVLDMDGRAVPPQTPNPKP